MKKKRPKKRNPVARAVRKLRPQVIPDKRRKLRDKAEQKD